jgi:hypothetical protein
VLQAIDAWSQGWLAGPVIVSTTLKISDLNFPDILPVIMRFPGFTSDEISQELPINSDVEE